MSGVDLTAAVDAGNAAEHAHVGKAWEAAGLGSYGRDERHPDTVEIDRARVAAVIAAAAPLIREQVARQIEEAGSILRRRDSAGHFRGLEHAARIARGVTS